MAKAQDIFVWEAPAWEKADRHPRWYLIMGGIAFLFAAYAVFTSNYLFAFIIFLTAIILVLAGNENPKAVLIQIGDNGIVVNGKLYQFDKLHNFAIIYHPPHTKVLYVEPNNAVLPRLRIDLEDQDPVAIRAHLLQYLDEDTDLRGEHYSDIFGRLLGI